MQTCSHPIPQNETVGLLSGNSATVSNVRMDYFKDSITSVVFNAYARLFANSFKLALS